MTARFFRYAIYWTPEPGSFLAEFGERWFGSDRGSRFGLSATLVQRAVETPSRYRLHATLKAPFRPAEGFSEAALGAALDSFCAIRRVPQAGPLRLTKFPRYLALVPTGKTADVDWLAAECVTRFDTYRAPLDAKDRERREHRPLTDREVLLLQEFGYPYIFDGFKFHVSLAGPLADTELTEVADALSPMLQPAMTGPLKIESLTLLGQGMDGGLFQPISRHRFPTRNSG